MKHHHTSPRPVPSRASRMAIIYRPIDRLYPDPANPRQHSKKQIRQIANSIRAFCFNVPILIDRNHNVIAGHGRLSAARELGMTEVPTLCLDHLTPEQARAFMITDNRLAEIAKWDDRVLAQQLKDLSITGLDFSLEITGFELSEIDLRIKSLENVADRPDNSADAVPNVPPGPAISRIGDHWLLGRHRVLCASALETTAFAALLGKERAAMVFTAPYNTPIHNDAGDRGAVHQSPSRMAVGEMDRYELTVFLRKVFRNLAAFSVDGALHYICMHWRHLSELLAAGRDAYGELKDLCVWVKENAGMGSLYRSQHELVFIFEQRPDEHCGNVQLGESTNRSNVWRYSLAHRGGHGNPPTVHPTVKPVAMVADAIRDGSARGEMVLDAFLGSGTTVLAAERAGRRCFGLERDPAHIDTIIRCWQALTGGRARHAVSDRTFDDLVREAEVADAD